MLVLDDYHVITEPTLHEELAYLLERMPPTLELVVTTRVKPPLKVARLRARGELVHVRAGELRFNPTEAAALLDGLGLDLSEGDVVQLQERTEGWAAGLYLAALSLRGRSDRHEFVARFAGDDRHLVDYLGAEVLEDQSEELRRFMLRSSILGRFCAPLCDALLDEGARSTCSPSWSARICSSCRSTSGASGTAITTSSARCWRWSASDRSPSWRPSFTAARRAGCASTVT